MPRTARRPAVAAVALSATLCAALATAGCSATTADPAPAASVAPAPPAAPALLLPSAARASTPAPPAPSPSPSTPSRRTRVRTTPAPTAAATRAAAPTHTAAPAAAGACSRLAPALVQVSGGAGSSYAVFSLTNRGASACTVHGYPTVAFHDASGRALGVVEQHGAAGPAGALLLRPGQAAYASTRVSLVSCDTEPVPAPEVVLTPPGGAGAALRVRPLPVCVGGPVVVSALAARA